MHLQDVGDLSSPALAKILLDTADSPGPFQRFDVAPSPAASASAAATPVGGSFSGQSDSSSTAGINLSNVPSPAESLTSLLRGGLLGKPAEVKPIVSETSRPGLTVTEYFSNPGVPAGSEGDSPAGSPTSNNAFGGFRRAASMTSPVSAQQFGSGQSGLSNAGGHGDRGVKVGGAEVVGWVPSPISAIGKEDGGAPWDSRNGSGSNFSAGSLAGEGAGPGGVSQVCIGFRSRGVFFAFCCTTNRSRRAAMS